jgi:alpha-beta hydrolase superfamily lysophospholipase
MSVEIHRTLLWQQTTHLEVWKPVEIPTLLVAAMVIVKNPWFGRGHVENPRAALVWFSLGGMINRRCAMDHPDRVSALVILNSPHERGEDQPRWRCSTRSTRPGRSP